MLYTPPATFSNSRTQNPLLKQAILSQTAADSQFFFCLFQLVESEKKNFLFHFTLKSIFWTGLCSQLSQLCGTQQARKCSFQLSVNISWPEWQAKTTNHSLQFVLFSSVLEAFPSDTFHKLFVAWKTPSCIFGQMCQWHEIQQRKALCFLWTDIVRVMDSSWIM